MRKRLLLALLMCCAGWGVAQDSAPVTRANVAGILGFEGPALKATGLPRGWWRPDGATVTLDTEVKHGGAQSLRIERGAAAEGKFTPVSAEMPMDFKGKQLELRGWLRVQDVKEYATLWLRVDDAGGTPLDMDNGASQHHNGTLDWEPFHVSVPLGPEVRGVVFGAFLSGPGTMWADDLELLVDGIPVAQAETRPVATTILDRDLEFSKGSGLRMNELTDVQVESLATLVEVWGFLKYHHPVVTHGGRQWDFDLIRMVPKVLAAKGPAERNAALLAWLQGMGGLNDCAAHAPLDVKNLVLQPDLAWTRDAKHLGSALSAALAAVYACRPTGEQFYMGQGKDAANPVLLHELNYDKLTVPDAGFQLLTLARWWNELEWWYPDRALLPDLHATLRRYVRPMMLAKTKDSFTLETIKLIGEARDTHANLWGSLGVRPPVGVCHVPVVLRPVGGEMVVWTANGEALQRGDVLETIDGKAMAQLIQQWAPFYDDSNEAARQRDMAAMATNGACGPVTLGVRRGGAAVTVTAQRVADQFAFAKHDLGGETFQLLSKDVAYLQLSSVKIKDVGSYVEQAKGTRGLIIDVRNYPSEFVVFALGQLLVNTPRDFVKITSVDLANPGAFSVTFTGRLEPRSPHYAGRVVLLVDEQTQSQAEYTTMALRTAPGALVVGSQTAGADGNVSNVPLPFGMRSLFSGLGILTPEGGQTQQVGIALDIEAVPTVAGIADSRDEVLEAGVRAVLGAAATEVEVRRIARRQ